MFLDFYGITYYISIINLQTLLTLKIGSNGSLKLLKMFLNSSDLWSVKKVYEIWLKFSWKMYGKILTLTTLSKFAQISLEFLEILFTLKRFMIC